MEESETAVKKFYTILKSIEYKVSDEISEYSEIVLNIKDDFIQAMDDDFNTAKAISILFDLVKHIKTSKDNINLQKEFANLLVELGKVLGFFKDLEVKLSNDLGDLSENLLSILIAIRNQAKQDKNWALSDQIRDKLLSLGIQLLDTKDGTKWEKK